MIASTYVQIHYSHPFLSNSSFYHNKFTASAGGASASGAVAATNSSPSTASSTAVPTTNADADRAASVASSTTGASADTGASTAISTTNAGSATATGRPSGRGGRGHRVSIFYSPFLVFVSLYRSLVSRRQGGSALIQWLPSEHSLGFIPVKILCSFFL